MWWFFKKKNTSEEVEEKLRKINSSIQLSFNNVKKDISRLTSRINHHDITIMDLNNLLQEHSKSKQAFDIKQELNLEEIESSSPDILSGLTNLQKSILLRLKLLSKETNNGWVAMKLLSQDLYPDKNYNDIKSMVSTYTDTLLQLNLIKKKRKGREIHLNLTEKTHKIMPKQEIRIKKA